jgi:hypothetical protein
MSFGKVGNLSPPPATNSGTRQPPAGRLDSYSKTGGDYYPEGKQDLQLMEKTRLVNSLRVAFL